MVEYMYEIALSPYAKIFYNEWQLDHLSNKYNIVFDQTLSNTLDVTRLKVALNRFVADHLLMNSHVVLINKEPCWIQNSRINELEHFEYPNKYKEIFNYISKPFNIEAEPLYRFMLFNDPNGSYRFIIVLHHLLVDGESVELIISLISKYYNDHDYKSDYSLQEQQNILLSSNELFNLHIESNFEKSAAFWTNTLSGKEPLDFTFLRPYTKIDTTSSINFNRIKEIKFNFEPSYILRLGQVLHKHKMTLYFYSQCILAILLYRYTRQENFVISYSVAIKDGNKLICGAKINTNLAPFRLKPSITIAEIFNQNRLFRASLKSNNFNYGYYPINKIMEGKNRNLLDISFAQTNLKDVPFDFISTNVLAINGEFNIDFMGQLLFEQELKDNQLNFRVRYDVLATDMLILDIFIKDYQKLFINILLDLENTITDKSLAHYCSLNADEYNEVVYQYNNTYKSISSKAVHQLFEEQVIKYPNSIALVCNNIKLTYQKLNQKANQLAHYLKRNYEIEGDNLVGIFLDRSEYMIVAILGVLKSGAGYIPIDLKYPDERISHILHDTNAKVTLINKVNQSRFNKKIFKNIKTLPIDGMDIQSALSEEEVNNPNFATRNNNLAYVIYTSGTTGKPKGVMVEHRNLINFIESNKQFIRPNDNVLNYISYTFDAVNTEIYISLLNCGQLYIINEQMRLDLDKLFQYIMFHKITFLVLPAIVASTFTAKYDLATTELRTIIIGGDIYNGKKISNKINLVNAYGTTETTVCSTFKILTQENYPNNIGTPVLNTCCYVLNKDHSLLPIGAVGELYIGGFGVSRGYLNDSKLNKERFINNLFRENINGNYDPHKILYKTGDLVRRLPSGDIEYIGRADNQVKFNGYRISLDEIDAVLIQFIGVKQCISKLFNKESDASKCLVSYYVSDINLNQADIMEHLSSKLPYYMLPSNLIRLDKIPLTINGKLDYKALPPPISSPSTHATFSNIKEQMIAEAFSKVLGRDHVGLDENFFSINGNSLSAISLVTLLQKDFSITIQDIFTFKTPRNIANNVTQTQNFLHHCLEKAKLF